MTNIRRALEAAAGGGGDPLYVEDVFSTYLYDGVSSGQMYIQNGIDLSGEGGLIWIKSRGATYDNFLFSTGLTSANNYLRSNTTGIEDSTSLAASFESDGFKLNSNNGMSYDGSGYGTPYVSWTFRKAENFFTMVEFTADDGFPVITHDLGSLPGMVIYKCTSSSTDVTGGDWYCWHSSMANNTNIVLNTTAAQVAGAGKIGDVTSTQCQFYCTVGETYIAYYFGNDQAVFGAGSDENIIKCGSFSTDASGIADVTLGWEPQYVLVKKTSAAQNWVICDTMRGWSTSTTADKYLAADTSSAESDQSTGTPTATGFYIDAGSNFGASSDYIYIAIRRPMKVPEAGTEVFTPVAYSGAASGEKVLSLSMNPDLTTIKIRDRADRNGILSTKLFNGEVFHTSSTMALDNNAGEMTIFDTTQNTIRVPYGLEVNYTGYTYVCEAFRRASGFLDIVNYTGTGVTQNITHNLTVAPTMMWIKREDIDADWAVFSSVDKTMYAHLNLSNGFTTGTTYWNSTLPTSTVFTVGTDADVNASTGTYAAYLWGNVDGVCKAGSYTGTGADQNINCGFAARFVMIKYFDSGSNWIYLDSARGLATTPTNPFLRYDTIDAEVTWDNYVLGHANGFTAVGSHADVNTSGGTYIYLAIA